MTSLRVAVVMPPTSHLDPADALELWPTFTRALEALRAAGQVDPVGCCRSAGSPRKVDRNGVAYYFEASDRDLAARVAALHPDFHLVAELEKQGVVATAPGTDSDFVSRYFAPAAGIPEDPVTGSTHCTLIPYWSKRLGKRELFARQISSRGGELFCEDRGERVGIGGNAVTYSEGKIHLA